MRRLFYLYQRAMFYITTGHGEIAKPLTLYNSLAILVVLLKTFGIGVSWEIMIELFLGGNVIMLGIGYYYIKSGTMGYVNELQNAQNKELTEILRRVKENK